MFKSKSPKVVIPWKNTTMSNTPNNTTNTDINQWNEPDTFFSSEFVAWAYNISQTKTNDIEEPNDE